MKIKQVNCNFEREPLLAPFGFKCGYVNETWLVVAQLRGEKHKGVGLGLQSALWSDAGIFSRYSEAAGAVCPEQQFLCRKRRDSGRLRTLQQAGVKIVCDGSTTKI